MLRLLTIIGFGSGESSVMGFGRRLFPPMVNEWQKVGGNVLTMDAMIQILPGTVLLKRKIESVNPMRSFKFWTKKFHMWRVKMKVIHE